MSEPETNLSIVPMGKGKGKMPDDVVEIPIPNVLRH